MIAKFEESQDRTLSKFNSQCQFRIKKIQRDFGKLIESRTLISQMKMNIISQMNDTVFPIPKTLLSFYVKQIFDSGFYYVSEYSMKKVITDVYDSENFNVLKIDLEKLQRVKNKNLLVICLPYDLEMWKKQLKKYFTQNIIEDTFKKFNNENGSYGTSSDTFVIIVNADILKSVKDVEEVVQHQFVHMFEDINQNEESKISFNLEKILKDKNQYYTYVINLINRLFKIYDRYCILNHKKDSFDNRKIFLDKIFKLAEECSSSILLSMKMKYYNNSSLLESNMYFLWHMIHDDIDEFDDFKTNIYKEFLEGYSNEQNN